MDFPLRASNKIVLLPSSLAFLFKGWPGRSSIARVERAHSDRARSASRRTIRLPFSSRALREHRRLFQAASVIFLSGDARCRFYCARRTRPFRFFTFSRGSRQTVLHCAHRATTALSWGLCEQEGWLPVPSSFFTLIPSPHPYRMAQLFG